MVEVLQAFGILYLLLMLYLSFLYYKRNNYSLRSFLFWVVVWGFGVMLMLFPQTSSLVTQTLKVPRIIDFYLITGLMFFSIITFFNYGTVRRNEAKIEELVRIIALQKGNSKAKEMKTKKK